MAIINMVARAMVLLAALCGTLASVPVLLWHPESAHSPVRLESQADVGVDNVLAKLGSGVEQPKAFLLFLQDELRQVDFVRYGGKANRNFRALKKAMADHVSVGFNEVAEGGERLLSVLTSLANGNVVTIKDSEDLEALEVSGSGQLVVVPLKAQDTDCQAVGHCNDGLVEAVIGRISHLTEDNYIAAYSAYKPTPLNVDLSFKRLRRRQVDDQGKDAELKENRYFTPAAISVLFVMSIFVMLLLPATYFLKEIHSTTHFQDQSTPMVGKE